MIRVCDAIMGSGKSESAIRMMNEHPDRKYIYITPYLDEANRIKQGCPDLNFVEPSSRIQQYRFRKTEHTNALISEGCNITTTHQAFLFYTEETLDLLKDQKYTLVIDENVSVLESVEVSAVDIQLLVKGEYLEQRNGMYTWTGKEYDGRIAKDFMRIARSRDLACVEKQGGLNYEMFFWVLPPELLTAFDDVYILTYLFTGQSLYYFATMYDLPYEYIGIEQDEFGYHFCEYPGYTPEYTKELHDKIHIVDDERLNDIGDNYYAMSMNWFETRPEEVHRLKSNIASFFRYRMGYLPADQKMWGTHKKGQDMLKGKGYTKSFLTFNARATNSYRNRTCLAYAINVFMNVGEKVFFTSAGIEVDEDAYALSTMIQWIWRSAIRDGNEIYLYIPSRRMRELLIAWIDDVRKGGVSTGG